MNGKRSQFNDRFEYALFMAIFGNFYNVGVIELLFKWWPAAHLYQICATAILGVFLDDLKGMVIKKVPLNPLAYRLLYVCETAHWLGRPHFEIALGTELALGGPGRYNTHKESQSPFISIWTCKICSKLLLSIEPLDLRITCSICFF